MHFRVFVEDESGKRALDVLIGKIIGSDHTFKVYPYRGMGRTPENLETTGDPKKRILLQRLPKILQGLGYVHAGYPDNYSEAVVVVCDLDRKDRDEFLQELLGVLDQCNPKPEVRFCLAIEEGEAWLLGDIPAIKAAYPRAKNRILNSYENDSICNTWELLANAIYEGGESKLKSEGKQAVGTEKCRWAENISPHMDVSNNKSPSFKYFRDRLLELV